MKKTKSMRLAVLAAGLLCCSIFTVPAYAQSSEPQEETPPAQTEAQPETQNPFSTDGTGTVVDNATDEDGKEIAVRGFCLGFRFPLCGFLRGLRGLGLRFRLGLRGQDGDGGLLRDLGRLLLGGAGTERSRQRGGQQESGETGFYGHCDSSLLVWGASIQRREIPPSADGGTLRGW